MKIAISELEALIKKALLTQYPEDQAELIKNVVMFGELSGKQSHGILRLLKENYGVFVDTKKDVEYIHKTKVSTIIHGNGNPGMLVGSLALNEVIKLAKDHDIGIVGTKGSINTTGSLSYYVEEIAQKDLIGIIFTHASPFMAPFGSKKALFGTNPLAFGFPSDPRPLIFDMSTAAITYGAIAKLKSEEKPLPPDLALDEEGIMTTDPAKAEALLPMFNSYKGSGLAMMIEVLGGLWPGASFGGLHPENGWGNLYMAFSPNLLSDVESFKKSVQELINMLKHADTTDGQTIRLPGEKALQIRDENIKKGEVEVNEEIIEKIKQPIS